MNSWDKFKIHLLHHICYDLKQFANILFGNFASTFTADFFFFTLCLVLKVLHHTKNWGVIPLLRGYLWNIVGKIGIRCFLHFECLVKQFVNGIFFMSIFTTDPVYLVLWLYPIFVNPFCGSTYIFLWIYPLQVHFQL